MPETALLIRPSNTADLPKITAIYGWNVLNGTGTFELDAPPESEMARRRAEVLANGLPWLVAERDGVVVGFAYANPFRPRRAFRFCLEDSVYLTVDVRRQGVGTLLLVELMARCEAAGARQMMAVIGDSQNLGSIGLHRSVGFEPVGVMKDSGWKARHWLDVVIMQKALGAGASTHPANIA